MKQKNATNSGSAGYRAFSLTWPASMQIYCNKRERLHKKRVQLPQDWFGTPTWPPFHCFGTPIWPPWRHVKTFHVCSLFHLMDTLWLRSCGKIISCKSEATSHKLSETRRLSTTCVFHPQELNTCWIASGKFSTLNYLFCSSYVEFLETFLRYTSADHVDRKKLTQAIAKFKDLDTLFRQVIKNKLSLIHYIIKKELNLSA